MKDMVMYHGEKLSRSGHLLMTSLPFEPGYLVDVHKLIFINLYL